MNKLISTCCLAALLTATGCSNVAPKGEGGLAEHDYSNYPNHPVGMEDALYFEQQLSQRHLDALLAAGANICFPASIQTAKIRQARIARELQGGLRGDAANDLIIQRDKLTRLERRLHYVQMHDSCIPSDSYKSSAITNKKANEASLKEKQNLDSEAITQLTHQQEIHIIALLNNNNQFVTDSTLLNPRYIGQLSEAVELLRRYPQYHLILTGHSDSKGSRAANLKLSLARAAQVERYLLIFGFNPNNIQVNGSGEVEPLFNGNQPQVRLVNRRVDIQLSKKGLTSADGTSGIIPK